jgi:putative SOS response-associated peptidase YedK
VILDPDAEAGWLDPDAEIEELLELLVPLPDDALVAHEVPDLVNDVRKDGPELIAPREEAEEQSALF